MIITNTDPGNFTTDGVFVEPVTVPPTPAGPATGMVDIVSGANYGPVDSPQPFTDGPSLISMFGTDTTSQYSLVRAALTAMPECQSFLGVRVTDGTDVAAVLDLGTNGNYAAGALTAGGTPAAGNTVSMTVAASSASGALSYTSEPYTVLSSDSLDDIIAAVIKLFNQTGAVIGSKAFVQPVFPGGSETIGVAALKPGTAGNSIVISGTTTGGGATLTPGSPTALTGGTGGSDVNFLVLTNKFTGSLPNPGQAGATALVTVQSGSMNYQPVLSIAINFPGYQTEVYQNIKAYATAGGAYDATTAQANAIAAINGTLPNQSGSAYWTAVAGSAQIPPTLNTPQAADGGTDGTSGLTPEMLLGDDLEVGPTGLYALNGQVSGAQVMIAGLTDPTIVPDMIVWRTRENCVVHFSFEQGTTTDAAIGIRQSYGLANPGLVLGIDWVRVNDSLSGGTLLSYPSAKIAGIISGVSAYLSPGNQPVFGAQGLLGTERIVNGINSVTQAEAGRRQQNGILYIGRPPRSARGPLFGLPNGMTSDGVTRILDIRMLCFVTDLLQQIEGQFVDGPIDTNPANLGQPTFGLIQKAAMALFNAMKFGQPQQISDFSFTLGSQNTSLTAAQGFLIISVNITTLSSAQFILNLLQVGPNVQVVVQTAQ